MEFEQRLKFLRKNKQMTQRQLGELIGFNTNSADIRICQYEKGIKFPNDITIDKITKTLNISPNLLLSNNQDEIINIYIDLYWQLISGKDIVYISKIYELAQLIDSERFEKFQNIINEK